MSLDTNLYYRITDLPPAQAITGAEVVEAVQNGKNVRFSLDQLFVAGKSAYDVAVENGYTGVEAEWLASLVGTDGASAFELAKSAGFTGTLSEWLASLKGSDGADGANGLDGKSAYQVAVSKGFVGTEVEWLATLVGKDGRDGLPGTNGINGVDGRDGRDGTNGLNGANGLDGRDGINGTNGTNGKSAYQIAVDGGFVGTEAQWLLSLKGLKGDTGDAGQDGTDGSVGADGKSAYQIAVEAGFIGTEAEWLDSLRNGPAGADGKSAYTIAVEAGFVGTEIQWLDSLKGADGVNGTNGTNGQSAYDLAVSLGYVGTQAQWLASLKGADGVDGTNGTNGVDGSDGVSAYAVAVTQGFVGTEAQWLASLKGADGVNGTNGTNGTNGIDGADGQDGKSAYEIAVLNGFIGTEVDWLASLKGADGAPGGGEGGGAPIGELYNPVTRYQALTVAGQTVYVSSSSTLYYGCSWNRAGTNLTINRPGHGHNVGDRAIVRNTNVPFQIANITAVTADSYTVTCADTGALSGAAAAYSMGFNYAHTGAAGSITGGTLQAPGNSDVQLLSFRMHLAANTRAGNTYNLTVPKGTLNGVGLDTNMDDVYLPFQQVRQDGTTLSAVGNTIATSIGGDFGTFQFAALPAVTTGLQIMASF